MPPAVCWKSAPGAQQGGAHFRAGGDEEEKERDQRGRKARVEFHAHGEVLAFAALDVVERGEADEAARTPDLVHDGVAGVDAGGAVHAFHLCAVANVDAGGTDGDTLAASDAVTEARGGALDLGLAAVKRGAFLAAFVVVGHDHGILVEHGGLEAAIGTDEGAGLHPEARVARNAALQPASGVGPRPG